MFSILHRMIFWEMFRVFFLCWVGLTGMLLMGGIVAEASQQGLGPAQVLELIPFLIPSTMPYTLPATTLFATCVVFGRLSTDNEILAIKAAGINLVQVAIPAICLGLLATGVTLYLFFDVIPATQFEIRTRFIKNLDELLYGMLNKDSRIKHPQIPFEITVDHLEGRKLIKANFLHRDPKTGIIDTVAQGREAELKVETTEVNGEEKTVIYVRMWNGRVIKDKDFALFVDETWPVELPNPPRAMKSRPSHMNWSELFVLREQTQAHLEKTHSDIDVHEARLQLGANEEVRRHVEHQRHLIRNLESTLVNISAEFQIRPALALGCLCFVLVGCPVGIWFGRSDYLSSFMTCFLPIVVVYYPLMLCGISWSKSGKLSPMLAVWPANLLLAAVAALMFRRLLRN